jgi:hypothetical protein
VSVAPPPVAVTSRVAERLRLLTGTEQRFAKVGLLAMAMFLPGPIIAAVGASIVFANDPFPS